MNILNQQVQVDLGPEYFTAEYKATTIQYEIALSEADTKILKEGEEIIVGKLHVLSLTDKLSQANHGGMSARYYEGSPFKIRVTLNAATLSEINFARITGIIGEHLIACKAALMIVGRITIPSSGVGA